MLCQITELPSLLPRPDIPKSCCTPGLSSWETTGELCPKTRLSVVRAIPPFKDCFQVTVQVRVQYGSFPETDEFGSANVTSEAAQRHLSGAISNIQELLSISSFCRKQCCFLEYLSLLVLITCCSIYLETK